MAEQTTHSGQHGPADAPATGQAQGKEDKLFADLSLHATANGLAILLDCPPWKSEVEPLAEEITDRLRKMKVSARPNIGQLGELAALKKRSRKLASHEIIVRRNVYPEVTLCIKGEKHIVRSQFRDPLKATCQAAKVRLQAYVR